MLSNLYRAIARLPRLMRAGLGLAVAGGAIDVIYHLAAGPAGAGHGPVAFTGHVVTLAGMVITMLGLLSVALKRRPAPIRTTTKGDIR